MIESQRQTLLQRVEACFDQLQHACNFDFIRPAVTFNQRGKVAGSARLQDNTLRFNPVLFAENPDAFIHEIVPHEACHLAAYQLYGRVKPHGEEWRALMSGVFNLPAQVTHQLDTRSVQGKMFRYRCECGEVSLSIRRHNKVLRNQAVYHCRRCNNRLVRA